MMSYIWALHRRGVVFFSQSMGPTLGIHAKLLPRRRNLHIILVACLVTTSAYVCVFYG